MRRVQEDCLSASLRVAFQIAFLVLLAAGHASASEKSPVAHQLQSIKVDREVEALDFSPDGRFLAITSGGTFIWSLKERRIIQHLEIGAPGGPNEAKLTQFSPDSKYFAICGYAGNGRSDFAVFAYETEHWTIAHEITGEKFTGCSGVLFSDDGKYLVRSKGDDVPVSWYDIRNWQVVGVVPKQLFRSQPADGISSSGPVSLSPGSRYLALGGSAFSKPPIAEREHLSSLEISQRTTFVHAVWLVDVPSQKLLWGILAPSHSLSWRSDGLRLAVGGDGAIRLLDPSSGATLIMQASQLNPQGFGSAQGTSYGRELAAFSPDARFMVEAIDRQVEIWDGNHAVKWQTISAVPGCIAISADSRLIALGGGEPSLLPAIVDLFVHPNGGVGRVLLYELK